MSVGKQPLIYLILVAQFLWFMNAHNLMKTLFTLQAIQLSSKIHFYKQNRVQTINTPGYVA